MSRIIDRLKELEQARGAGHLDDSPSKIVLSEAEASSLAEKQSGNSSQKQNNTHCRTIPATFLLAAVVAIVVSAAIFLWISNTSRRRHSSAIIAIPAKAGKIIDITDKKPLSNEAGVLATQTQKPEEPTKTKPLRLKFSSAEFEMDWIKNPQ